MQKDVTKNTDKSSLKTEEKVSVEAVKAVKTPKTPKTSGPQTMDELLAQTGYKLISWQRGKIIEGKVISVTPKQLLLDIGGKSEAIVHEKEMPFITDLTKNLKPGDKLTVQVVNSENDRGQTVVSVRKTAMQQRWNVLVEKMKKNETIEVVIRELSKGGFLVDYFGLRGFIPLSQIDSEYTKAGDRAQGRKVTCKIIEVDQPTNRLVFSQLAGGLSDKQKHALEQVELNKTYKADITGIAPFGGFVTVKIDDGVTLPGLIHISEIAWEKVEKVESYLKPGQQVEVKVIGIDKNLGKLTLSLKQLLADPWNDVMKVFSVDQTVAGKVSRITQFGAFVSLLPGIDGLIHISKIAPGEEPKVGENIECVIEELNPDKRKISLSMIARAKPIGYR